jgi:exopolysaccharide/PEP-CTERM locus tyrosine autokinase
MSKIQEALKKIQVGKSADNGEETVRIAQLRTEEVAAPEATGTAGERRRDSLLRPAKGRKLAFDHDALRSEGLLGPEGDEAQLANEYRQIKRPLIAHMQGRRATLVERGNIVMVTSAIQGEGKTFTAINLALSTAQERDVVVVLVDGDVAKPHITELFGVAELPGLLDLIEDPGLSVDDVIVPTDMEGLYVLPAGVPRFNATELLASARFENLLASAASKHPNTLFLFDSPPVLPTTEAKVLASAMGQIVLVVKAEHTPQELVSGALEALTTSAPINLILNQARMKGGRSRYGYGYGYQYGYGNHAKTAAAASDATDQLPTLSE